MLRLDDEINYQDSFDQISILRRYYRDDYWCFCKILTQWGFFFINHH